MKARFHARKLAWELNSRSQGQQPVWLLVRHSSRERNLVLQYSIAAVLWVQAASFKVRKPAWPLLTAGSLSQQTIVNCGIIILKLFRLLIMTAVLLPKWLARRGGGGLLPSWVASESGWTHYAVKNGISGKRSKMVHSMIKYRLLFFGYVHRE
jgi:hypothetical protein